MQDDLFSSQTEQPQVFELGDSCRLVYVKNWLPQDEAQHLMGQLRSQLPWQQPYITVAGKKTRIPRMQCWFGDKGAALRYSAQTFEPLPWDKRLSTIKNRLQDTFQSPYNSVLANLYRDGADAVGWHADNERELGSTPVIASVSLGETRKFLIKPRAGVDGNRCEFYLGSGDALIMSGNFQRNWLHSLPKTRKPVGERINLTYRNVLVQKEV